jgi:hypothetical protein
MSHSLRSVADRVGSRLAAAEPILLWVFLSLLSIAWVGRRPYVALAVVLLSGVAMGLSSVANYSFRGRDLNPDCQGRPKGSEQ